MSELTLLYVTYPKKEIARELVGKLLDQKLIACANILESTSIYTWKGKKEVQPETIVILKTTRPDKTKEEIRKNHPDETPCILTLSADAEEDYFSWVLNCCK